jgi:hypothetical protein
VPQLAQVSLPPYALVPTAFPFPALAAMAGRAPLGGPRETALACFLVARLAGELTAGERFPQEQQRARVQGVKHWLGAGALPGPLKAALARLAESTLSEDREVAKSAVDSVIAVTANQLDPGARLELSRLSQAIVK